MRKTAIGATGLEVTPLSFGASGLGSMPDTYGYAVGEARARATIERIFAGPANMLDTSRVYGFGRSEARIGAVIGDLGGAPEGFVLSTKLDRDVQTGRFDADQARRSLEESLTALRLDRIPIVHLHDPEHARDLTEITRAGGALDALFRMREEGLATAVGLAMGRIDIMLPLVRDLPFDVLISHNRFTLLNRQADALFDLAHQKGVAVFNAAPFAGGALAKGAAASNRLVYQETDAAGLAPVARIEEICRRGGVSIGAAALQFSMRDPRITSTIVGTTRPEGVDRNLDWASADIGAEIWAELEALPFSTEDPEATRAYRPG